LQVEVPTEKKMALKRKAGFHSGKVECYDIDVSNAMTIGGSITFGDVSTDTFTVNGLSTFNANVDINALVDIDTSSTNPILSVTNTGTGEALYVNESATNNASVIAEIEATSTNANNTAAGLLIDMNGTGDAGICLSIDDEATGATNAVLKVDSTRTGQIALFNITGPNANADMVEITVADGSTGTAMSIDMNETDGNAIGLHIDVASTGANAFAIKVTGIATNAGVLQTSVSTDCAIDNCTAVIRIQGGSSTYYIPCLSTFT
jgi:hypothetical protein